MSKNESRLIVAVLSAVFLLVTSDIVTDARHGAHNWHLLLEAAIAAISAFGIFHILRNSFQLKKNLILEKNISTQMSAEAEKWRLQSQKYTQGLSVEIDKQLNYWNLTKTEKEVAFLLLKGLSTKEIAESRNTSEKTARAQATAIYAKSGLGGRSELAAFFLEDLLVPGTSFSASQADI